MGKSKHQQNPRKKGSATLKPNIGADSASLCHQLTLQHLTDSMHLHTAVDGGDVSDAASPDLVDKLVKQVEFYFSDQNLPSDNYLLKAIESNADGYVALDAIASFNKVKALTTDVDVLRAALTTSKALQLSSNGQYVRRTAPLVPVDALTRQQRTVIVDSFVDKPTVADVRTLFKGIGDIEHVAVCLQPSGDKDSGGGHKHVPAVYRHAAKQHKLNNSVKDHAFVEFRDVLSVQRAIDQLDVSHVSWNGLRVRPLLTTKPHSPASDGHSDAAHKPASDRGNKPTQRSNLFAQADPHTPTASGNDGAHRRSSKTAEGSGGNAAEPSLPISIPVNPLHTDAGLLLSSADRAAGAKGGIAVGSPSGGGYLSGGKAGRRGKYGKKDYANWAAASPDAAAKYNLATGSPTLGSYMSRVHHIRTEASVASPLHRGTSNASDGAGHGVARIARMPDGSKGFSIGRGRGLAPPN